MRELALAVSLALLIGSADGQVDASDSPICVKAARLPLPAQDQPSPVEQAKLKRCSSLDLYYGVGQPADLPEARACAYTMRGANPAKNVQEYADGMEAPAALAMIYANGKGVAPNLGLAVKFACEVRGGWDDGTPQAVRLDGLRIEGKRSAELDFCMDVTGRWMNYYCITRDQAWVDAALKQEERRAQTTGSPEARAAFAKLQHARRAYLGAHGPELPNGTTGAVQTAMREEVDEAQHWLAMLREARSGKPPDFDEAAFHKADQALNAAYRQALKMTVGSSGQYGDVNEKQLRTAERAWLRYREAWVEYARLRLPQVPSDRWRAELTVERTDVLGGGA